MRLIVYDVLGREVAQLVNGTYEVGYHSTTWDATGVASGVYFAHFTAKDGSGNIRLNKVNKLLLTKKIFAKHKSPAQQGFQIGYRAKR